MQLMQINPLRVGTFRRGQRLDQLGELRVDKITTAQCPPRTIHFDGDLIAPKAYPRVNRGAIGGQPDQRFGGANAQLVELRGVRLGIGEEMCEGVPPRSGRRRKNLPYREAVDRLLGPT